MRWVKVSGKKHQRSRVRRLIEEGKKHLQSEQREQSIPQRDACGTTAI